jgi:hypothetical protein
MVLRVVVWSVGSKVGGMALLMAYTLVVRKAAKMDVIVVARKAAWLVALWDYVLVVMMEELWGAKTAVSSVVWKGGPQVVLLAYCWAAQ